MALLPVLLCTLIQFLHFDTSVQVSAGRSKYSYSCLLSWAGLRGYHLPVVCYYTAAVHSRVGRKERVLSDHQGQGCVTLLDQEIKWQRQRLAFPSSCSRVLIRALHPIWRGAELRKISLKFPWSLKVRMHLVAVPQKEGESLQEGAVSLLLPDRAGGMQEGGNHFRQPLVLCYLHNRSCDLQGWAFPRLGAALYVYLPVGECFPVWGRAEGTAWLFLCAKAGYCETTVLQPLG